MPDTSPRIFLRNIGTRKYLDLLWQYTKRGVAARHKGSYLGSLWPVLTPLLMLGLYVVVFGLIFGGSFNVKPNETTLDYGLAIFVGLSLVQFVGEIMSGAPAAIVSAPNLVKKVVFPLSILPNSTVGIALFNYAISMALALLGIALLGDGLTWNALWILPLLIPITAFCAGLAFFLAALGVFLRDITQLTGFLHTVVLYASAVFYPVAAIQKESQLAWDILKFNPILQAAELFRKITVWGMPPTPKPILFLCAASFLTLGFGWLFFKKIQPTFADVL
jgi:lipopolysaccharide transport system permease protein